MVALLHLRSNSSLVLLLWRGNEALTFDHFPRFAMMPAPPCSFCQVTRWYIARSSSASVSPSTSAWASSSGNACEMPYNQSFTLRSICQCGKPRHATACHEGKIESLPRLVHLSSQQFPGYLDEYQQRGASAMAHFHLETDRIEIVDQSLELLNCLLSA